MKELWVFSGQLGGTVMIDPACIVFMESLDNAHIAVKLAKDGIECSTTIVATVDDVIERMTRS